MNNVNKQRLLKMKLPILLKNPVGGLGSADARWLQEIHKCSLMFEMCF